MRRVITLGCLSLAMTLTACGSDFSPGSQLVGQRCYDQSHCAEGLTCDRSRLCLFEPPAAPRASSDSGMIDLKDMGLDLTSSLDSFTDVDQKPDCREPGEPFCIDDSTLGFCDRPKARSSCLGEAFCLDGRCVLSASECAPGGEEDVCLTETSRHVCRQDGSGVTSFEVQLCLEGEVCLDGLCLPRKGECMPGVGDFCANERVAQRCVEGEDGLGFHDQAFCPQGTACQGNGECVKVGCEDRDNDGAFVNCEPFDCDDSQPSLSPLLDEVCGDALDNDCDGRADNGC